MTHRPILHASKSCGCVALIWRVDPIADAAKIVKVKRVIKRHNYKLEWLTPEEHKARPWECPEHRAQRVRMARERVAHQEQPALKG